MKRRASAALMLLGGASGLAFAAVATANAAVPQCAKHVRLPPLRLPTPLEVTTPCAVYTISVSGRAAVARRPRLPDGVTWMQIAGPGAAVVQRGGRIAVLSDGREVWRSRGRFRAAGVFATLGTQAVAFSYESYTHSRSREHLYLAPLRSGERELAANEQPLGWTTSGRLLTWRFRQGFFGLYRRGADGTLRARVGTHLREVRFEPASRSVLALTRTGRLERYDGRWQRLANLSALGLGRQASFEPLAGGLIGVLQRRRVLVLHADGTVFASARFRSRRGAFSVGGESGLVANAAGSAVAFAVTVGDNGGGIGRESLYVLRAGDQSARELYTGTLSFAVCERWASLDWNGGWLLYATTEGRTLALDSRAPTHRIDLTRLIGRLASTDSEGKTDAQVRWAASRAS